MRKSRFLNTGYRIAPSFTDRIVSKCTTRRAVVPAMGTLKQEPDWMILRSKVKVKYAKNTIFKHGVPHSSFICRPNRLKMHQATCRGPSYGNTEQEPDWRIFRSKVKVNYAKNYIFSHIITHSVHVYCSNWFKTRILFKSPKTISRSKVKVTNSTPA